MDNRMTEYSDEVPASKTQQKRDMEALVEKAERLMSLKPAEQARLPLLPAVEKAVNEARRISSADARRRHALHLARLLDDENGEATLAALQQLDDPVRQQRLNGWLEQLVNAETLKAANSVMEEVHDFYPDADRQHLRNLVRNVIKQRPESETPVPEKFKRERKRLAQYLNELERLAPLY